MQTLENQSEKSEVGGKTGRRNGVGVHTVFERFGCDLALQVELVMPTRSAPGNHFGPVCMDVIGLILSRFC